MTRQTFAIQRPTKTDRHKLHMMFALANLVLVKESWLLASKALSVHWALIINSGDATIFVTPILIEGGIILCAQETIETAARSCLYAPNML